MFSPVLAHFWHFVLLAQTEGPAPAAPAQGDAPNTADPTIRLLMMILITGVLFYFIMLRPQKKKEQSLRDQVSNLKENARVVTIGGIYGVVTNVQRDAERVTIRVDESTGTKLRVNMSAIARVLTGEDEEKPAGGNKA
jgi:preprotein translocase subunit YajC